jgi:hypothetical protein
MVGDMHRKPGRRSGCRRCQGIFGELRTTGGMESVTAGPSGHTPDGQPAWCGPRSWSAVGGSCREVEFSACGCYGNKQGARVTSFWLEAMGQGLCYCRHSLVLG